MLKRFLLVSSAIAILATAASANSLTFTLSPSVQTYPPGANTAVCQTTGTAPCVIFQGALNDTDTDSSFLFVTGLTVSFDKVIANSYFTVDDTFNNDVPGLFVGDPDWLTNGQPASNSYTGPVFGLDFAPNTPVDTYTGTVTIDANGGTSDPGNAGFTVQQSFTVVITPEPSTALLVLLPLVAIRRFRKC